MKITHLCLSLKQYYACDFLYADQEQEIYTCNLLSCGAQLQTGVLYLCLEVPALPAATDAAFSLLVMSVPGRPTQSELRQRYPRANVISVQTDKFTGLFNAVSDIFLNYNRFTAQMNRLSHVSSSNRGMQALLDEASRMLEAPIVVIDSSYRLLAMSAIAFGETGECHLEEQRRLGFLTKRNLNRLRRDRVFEQIRRQPDQMIYNLPPDANHWWANMLVYVHGVEVAEIGIMENRHKFTEFDFELMKQLRYLVSFEVLRDNSFWESRGAAHGLLVAELLEHRHLSAEVVKHRTALLRWPASPFYFALTVFPMTASMDGPRHIRRQAEIIAAQVSRVLSRAYWRIGENDIVFLVHASGRDGAPIVNNTALKDVLRSSRTFAILSNPTPDLLKLRQAYEQTLALYRLRERFVDEAAVYAYAEHSALDIGRALQETQPLEDFYDPCACMIRDYDTAHHTHFMATLREFLIHVDDPGTAAKRLNIHKNTLYYRINKLRELFPIDLNDGNQRMRLQLTMELMKLEETDFREKWT